jgi:hypothetical protein
MNARRFKCKKMNNNSSAAGAGGRSCAHDKWHRLHALRVMTPIAWPTENSQRNIVRNAQVKKGFKIKPFKQQVGLGPWPFPAGFPSAVHASRVVGHESDDE